MPDRNGKPRPCGFCLTGHHQQCCVETLPWYGRTWKCECGCEKGTKKPRKAAGPVEVFESTSKNRKADARVRRVAQRELDKVLASEEVRKAVEEFTA